MHYPCFTHALSMLYPCFIHALSIHCLWAADVLMQEFFSFTPLLLFKSKQFFAVSFPIKIYGCGDMRTFSYDIWQA
jgi:hypothetical protein